MLGERIRSARKSKKYTQENLAELANINRVMVSRYESGAAEPELDNLRRIADALEVSLDYLLGRTDWPYFESRSKDGTIIEGGIEAYKAMKEKEPPVEIKRMPTTPEELEAFINQIINKDKSS